MNAERPSSSPLEPSSDSTPLTTEGATEDLLPSGSPVAKEPLPWYRLKSTWVAFFFVLAISGMSTTFYFTCGRGGDVVLEPDGDLKYVPPQRIRHRNSHYYFYRGTKKFKYVSNLDLREMEQIMVQREWTDKDILKMVALAQKGNLFNENRKSLRDLRTSLSRRGRYGWAYNPRLLMVWPQMARTLIARGLYYFPRKRPDITLRYFNYVLKFGTKLQNSDGTWPMYQAGLDIKEMALSSTAKLLPLISKRDRLFSLRLRNLLRRWVQYQESLPQFANALKRSYQEDHKQIQKLTAAPDRADPVRFVRHKLQSFFFYQPHRTRNQLAQLHREILRLAPMDYQSFLKVKEKKWATLLGPEKPLPWINRRGVELIRFSHTLFDIMERRFVHQFKMAGYKGLFAVWHYHRRHGEYPSDWSDLKNPYGKVPPDPYDHKPLPYDKKKVKVWSKGRTSLDHLTDSLTLSTPQ